MSSENESKKRNKPADFKDETVKKKMKIETVDGIVIATFEKMPEPAPCYCQNNVKKIRKGCQALRYST